MTELGIVDKAVYDAVKHNAYASTLDIAALTGYAKATVLRSLKKFNIDLSKVGTGYLGESMVNILEIVKLTPTTRRDIGYACSISENHIATIVKKLKGRKLIAEDTDHTISVHPEYQKYLDDRE